MLPIVGTVPVWPGAADVHGVAAAVDAQARHPAGAGENDTLPVPSQ